MHPRYLLLLLLLPLPLRAELPCWAFRPVHGDTVGAVGWARADTRPDEEAARQARFRAAFQLASYAGADKEAIFRAARLTGDGTTAFGGHRLGFPQRHRGEARVYVYAVLDPGRSSRAAPHCQRQCRPAACEPEWLCRPMQADGAGFVGVSAQAPTRYRQYRLATTNGQALLRLIYGMEVAAVSVYEQRESGGDVQRDSAERSHLEAGGATAGRGTRTVTAARCRHGQHEFVHLLAPDLEPLPGSRRQDWLSNPNLNGRAGGVGSARVPVSGRISEQIELAVRQGLIALAKSKQVTVRGETRVARDRNGRFVLQRVAETTEALVHGQVAGLRFRGEGLQREVVVWLIEAQDPARASD